MAQKDRAEKKAKAKTSGGWDRHRVTETHRKGKRSAKKVVGHARRRLDKEEVQEAARDDVPSGLPAEGIPDILCGHCGNEMRTVLVVLGDSGDSDTLRIDEKVTATPAQWRAFVESLKPGVTREAQRG